MNWEDEKKDQGGKGEGDEGGEWEQILRQRLSGGREEAAADLASSFTLAAESGDLGDLDGEEEMNTIRSLV